MVGARFFFSQSVRFDVLIYNIVRILEERSMRYVQVCYRFATDF